jgi:hypothetical protein
MTDVVVLDFETYYDREYSLSKITTEHYIRDPKFQTIGVAIKVNKGETRWYPRPQVEEALKSIAWNQSLVVAQNTMFDGAILKWHYGVDPKAWVDIMGMSRALYPHEKSHSLKSQAERAGVGQKGDEVIAALGKRYEDFTPEELARYGAYCINDVELTYELFTRYMETFSLRELRLIDLTLRMFIDPVLELDREHLQDHLLAVKAQKEALLSKLSTEDKSRLMSNPQLAEMLRERGVEPPTKISPTTGKETYAFAKTDEAFKALLEHENLEVQAIVAARLGVKSTLEETRTERFIDMSYRGKFPIPLRYYGAHSGRWSGCLVADTKVIVYDTDRGVVEKRIVDVLADDLVWDGVEFVEHEGVQFSGFQEVISWDGVTGTEDHVVFTDTGEISLREAMQRGCRLQIASRPGQDTVDAVRKLIKNNKRKTSV